MIQLFKEHIKNHIAIAVGVEDDKWYVQTTDTGSETYYSERIEYGLNTKEEALAIANHYAKQYDLEVIVWDEGCQPELYVYYLCDSSKSKNSMRLGGIYTDFEKLKERILNDYKEDVIGIGINLDVEEFSLTHIHNIEFAHVEIVNPNEAI